MNVILVKVTPKDQILFLSRDPILMTQAMVKNAKLALLLTHPQYNLQILNRMVKVKTLRKQQFDVKMIVKKHLSQRQTLELNTNPYNIHYRGRVTRFR